MEKEFGTKGAVFSLDAVSGAEYVKDTMKEAAIYFAVKKSLGPAPKGKEENTVTAPRVGREQFYSFKGSGKINKEEWKGNEIVPQFESIQAVSCKTFRGKGYIENKCKTCKGTGKIEETFTVLVGEEQNKEKSRLFILVVLVMGLEIEQNRVKNVKVIKICTNMRSFLFHFKQWLRGSLFFNLVPKRNMKKRLEMISIK